MGLFSKRVRHEWHKYKVTLNDFSYFEGENYVDCMLKWGKNLGTFGECISSGYFQSDKVEEFLIALKDGIRKNKRFNKKKTQELLIELVNKYKLSASEVNRRKKIYTDFGNNKEVASQKCKELGIFKHQFSKEFTFYL